MTGRGEDQTDEEAVLLIKLLQNVVSSTTCGAERTREEIVAKYLHYNHCDSHFQKRVLYVEKEISKERLRRKDVAALIQPIREE